jgi:hypothetical protein
MTDKRNETPTTVTGLNGHPIMMAEGQVPPDELAAYALEEFGNGFLTIFWLRQHAFDSV